MASRSSSDLKSPSRRWPDTWSSGMDCQVRDGAPSCVTKRRTSRHGLVCCAEHWLQPALYPPHRSSGPETPKPESRRLKLFFNVIEEGRRKIKLPNPED